MVINLDDGYRINGQVLKTFYGEDHPGILTCYLLIYFGREIKQFGGLSLDEDSGAAFVNDICNLFGVSSLISVDGKKCTALRNWSEWGSEIEGIEVDGKRFTLYGFRKKHWPATKTPIEEAKARISLDISVLKRRITENENNLEHLSDKYVDWETMK